jgi:hypothetical protein
VIDTWKLDVIAANDVPFRVLFTPTGSCPNHPAARRYYEGGPIVEFYDRRYDHTPDGQFICRYNLDVLTAPPHSGGLNLVGDIPAWSIDSATMILIQFWLDTIHARCLVLEGRPT